MDRGIEPRTGAPLVHGRMLYRCECCGESWFMYLEKGIEEFGENHKPSPFTIACPYCGGWAMDVSGIQKLPGGEYVQLPGSYHYFANVEDHPCGVPMLYETGIVQSGAKILIADELETMNGDPHSRKIMDELLEDMRKRTEEYIEAVVKKELLAEAEAAAQGFMEAARILAEQSTYSLADVMEAMANAFNGGVNPKRVRRAFSDLTTAWDRKEAREKLRAVERETASRFRQHKVRESAWAARRRTRPRQREWRGPWRGEKN